MAEMKTLNGYEVVDAKAREDIAALQASGGGGGSGAQVVIVDMQKLGYNMPEDQQAIFNEIFAAGVMSDKYTIYCKDGGRYYLCTQWEITQVSNYIQCPLYESSGYKYSLRIDFDNGVYRYAYRNSQSVGTKDWKWESYIANCGSYKHIKILIEWDNDSSKQSTHEISVDSSSYIGSSGHYYIADVYNVCSNDENYKRIYYNAGQYRIEVEDDSGSSSTVDSANIKGFWYWG